ncbi:hypothetical protein [Brevundimonas vesicularis]|uniref:hypothetical protein n=1 Tax=Brevundimonas vesicularis TaxID=41276 RepID=UPI00384F2915
MTLTAKDNARIALQWRKIESRAALLRGRVEAMPRAGMDGVLRAADQHIKARFMDKALDTLDRIDSGLISFAEREADRREREAASAHDKELEVTGVDTHRTTTGVGQRHGMIWLVEKKRLTGDRRRAAEAWAADYSLVRSDGLKSCLNDNAKGGSDGPSQQFIERKAAARWRLDRAHKHLNSATGSSRLANLVDAVCGRGDSVRSLAGGNQTAAERMEAELMVALDMACVSYGILRAAA